MKKVIGFLFIASLLFLFGACSNKNSNNIGLTYKVEYTSENNNDIEYRLTLTDVEVTSDDIALTFEIDATDSSVDGENAIFINENDNETYTSVTDSNGNKLKLKKIEFESGTYDFIGNGEIVGFEMGTKGTYVLHYSKASETSNIEVSQKLEDQFVSWKNY